jgi:protein O-GlcNAc transferase
VATAETTRWASLLRAGQAAAAQADFSQTEMWCDLILAGHANQGLAVLAVGALQSQLGNMELAEAAYSWAHQLMPDDPRPLLNLANCWQGSLRQKEALGLYEQITNRWPQDNRHWHNHLMALAYEPGASAADAKALAMRWANQLPAPELEATDFCYLEPLHGRNLRLGFLSADLCQHTVGLLLLPVAQALNSSEIDLFLYSASPQTDWLSMALKGCGQWRDIAGLSDISVAKLIRADHVDVLIDLGGHTAGTRLPVLHQQAAPLQLSWLGYWGSTGLRTVDGVILDHQGAPEDSEVANSFCEPVLRMAKCRWCYKPVPWMPKPSESPVLSNGYITFGSFNNTAKINHEVIDTWAEILLQVPNSRLVLKWKTLRDHRLRTVLLKTFELAGVDSNRIDLRGASVHAQMLQEYSDVDISLDPFPFNGGLTSCEALWLGLPLVTMRCLNGAACVAGLQGASLLEAINKREWIAENIKEYIQIASDLALSPAKLSSIRLCLRAEMQSQPFSNATSISQALEEVIERAYKEKQAKGSMSKY